MHKPANTEAELIQPIKERWSPRAFRSDQEIPQTSLEALFEAARWAPSCFNEQPWRFLAFGRQDAGRTLLESALTEGNKWACKASHLVLATAYQNFKQTGKPNLHHGYDTGAAVLSLVLQAQSQGIAAHQMAGFNQETLREAFQIPENISLLTVIALGYEEEDKENAGLNPTHLEKETGPRLRLSQAEVWTQNLEHWPFQQ